MDPGGTEQGAYFWSPEHVKQGLCEHLTLCRLHARPGMACLDGAAGVPFRTTQVTDQEDHSG